MTCPKIPDTVFGLLNTTMLAIELSDGGTMEQIEINGEPAIAFGHLDEDLTLEFTLSELFMFFREAGMVLVENPGSIEIKKQP